MIWQYAQAHQSAGIIPSSMVRKGRRSSAWFRLSCLLAPVFCLLALAAPPALLAQERGSESVFVGRGKVVRRDSDGNRYVIRRPPLDSDEELRLPARWTLQDVERLERECLEAVNEARRVRGLRPFELNKELLLVARDYSRRMATEGFFAHADPQGLTVRQRVNEAGIPWRVLGENLAYSNGYTNPVAASVSGWMDSEGHRRNMLATDFHATAIGVWVSAGGTVYFTEIFLRQ